MAKKRAATKSNTARVVGDPSTKQKPLTVGQLLGLGEKALDLTLIAGREGLDNRVTSAELHRPGLALAGFLGVFSHDRIQIIGNTEMSYLEELGPEERRRRLQQICKYDIPCMIITSSHPIPRNLIELANENRVPILKTSIYTSRFMARCNNLLEQEFAPALTVHGVLMDVFGTGVLIMGQSGVGKSECGLELVQRGHRLVADDVVILRRHSKSTVVGRCSPVTKYHMEVRGLGIINVEALFGAGAVLDEKFVDLVARLELWQQDKEYDRLGIDDHRLQMFDVEIPEYVIPVEPGRNISILIEVAAMNQRLKNTGFNPARSLNEQLIQHMQKTSASHAARYNAGAGNRKAK